MRALGPALSLIVLCRRPEETATTGVVSTKSVSTGKMGIGSLSPLLILIGRLLRGKSGGVLRTSDSKGTIDIHRNIKVDFDWWQGARYSNGKSTNGEHLSAIYSFPVPVSYLLN